MNLQVGMILKNVDWEGPATVEVLKFNEGPDGITSVQCKRNDGEIDDIPASEFLSWLVG
ncbi:MAG: hypothetical protein PHF86_03355 [Candidatus Nanoarchaeia archaeon]|jgi:hypothetical protein|nr:hypothetical protein [Candidatus Nanoarchaeia archaeon]